MFSGEYEYKVDHKGRVPFPPRFREQMREGMVMSRGLDRCANVYPRPLWERLSAQPSEQSRPGSRARRMRRLAFATAFFVELDGHGRVAIPLPLRQYAEIRDVAVVAGVDRQVEIWSRENWEAERKLMAREARRVREVSG